MYSPTVALAWEFWWRHRWGLAGVVALVVGFALVCAFVPLSQNTASVHSIWIVMGLCYVIGVFAYGFEGRLETAESGFPARLFVLPVRTWVLAGGPMLQGAAVAVLLWLGWDHLVLRPSGVQTPAWWTAMLAAVVAVSQAIVWLPFGLPWLRLLVAICALTVLVRAPLFFALAGAPFADSDEENRVLMALALALIPVAFLSAWVGVARVRRGDGSDWLRAFQFIHRAGGARREGEPFTTPLRAQVWYEWRTRDRGFVITVACVLAVFLVIAVLVERRVTWHIRDNVLFLSVPLMLAPIWSAQLRPVQLTAFASTRPLNNSALISAKFWAAGLGALGAWALVLAVNVGWILYTGGRVELEHLWRGLVAQYGLLKVWVGCVLVGSGSVLFTWRLLVVGLWAGLTGRWWLVVAQTVVLVVLGFKVLSEMALWNTDLARREWLRVALVRIAGVAVVAKLIVAGWALRALCRRGELTIGTAGSLLVAWSMLAAVLFGLLVWLVPAGVVSVPELALGVVLILPLARLALAPLALAWNRHG
jgi:hypothetical protein